MIVTFGRPPFEIDAEFGGVGTDHASGLGRDLNSRKMAAFIERANTTIAIVATDMVMDKSTMPTRRDRQP